MEIREDLKKLIPPLTPGEVEELEKSLLAEGCRDPLDVWGDILIDGHHRYEICIRHGIPYQTRKVDFADTDEAKIWIASHQLGRRNLTPFARAELALVRRDILLAKGRAKQKQTLGGYKHAPSVLLQNNKTDDPHNTQPGKTLLFQNNKSVDDTHNTRKTIADDTKISTGQLAKVEQIIKRAPEEVKDKLRRGEVSINKAYQEVKRKSIGEAIHEPPELPAGKYSVIYADPPWRYEFSISSNREIENHYPTMSLEEICALNVSEIADKDCVLFLWATNPKLLEATEVIKAWGFSYRTNMVWVKDKIGMGYYARQQHELLLIAVKGKLPLPKPGDRVSSVINEPRTKHSKKPERVYEIIEAMYPECPKIELFARTNRLGWNVWGNQI